MKEGDLSMRATRVSQFGLMALLSLTVALGLTVATFSAQMAGHSHTSRPFTGVKANTGTVVHTTVGGKSVLTLSDDFKVPDTPDPHWQVVDSNGNVYLLERLQAKNGKYNKSITLPPYIHDVAKVQIWCGFAETLLGEAPFDSPVK
jgi:hypothetical protein